jgi:small conductance mechanosensitive channel
MTTPSALAADAGTRYLAVDWKLEWHRFWVGTIGEWILTRGLRIIMLVLAAILLARLVTWGATKVTSRIDEDFRGSDALVRSETAKHRQAVASVLSWVTIAVLCVMVFVEITNILAIPVSSLVAPAAVLGAALGFGAQRIVQDLLSGFFIITEKQYGFGDLVRLSITSSTDAMGTVEDVTLRVTKLRTSDGEMYTIPNGQIVKALNLSKDWARAVVDIPVPASADLNRVNDVLHAICDYATEDAELHDLLLDKPQLMGVESIELDTVNERIVARTLPGKQFEVGRRLRLLVVEALSRAGIAIAPDSTPIVGAIVHPATIAGAEEETQGPDEDASPVSRS